MTFDENQVHSEDKSEQIETKNTISENNCNQDEKTEGKNVQEDESVTYFKEKIDSIEKSLESLVTSKMKAINNDYRDATGNGVYLLQFRLPSDRSRSITDGWCI